MCYSHLFFLFCISFLNFQVADAFDFVGFVLLALFNGFVASRQQDVLTSWFSPFIIMTGCASTSLVSLVVALVLET
jgi:hypothetical protein